jgi:short-subunit dehydrogenase
MASSTFDDKAVLVTGAAGGIGRATALLFASRGARLFLCDVNAAGLEETASLARRHGKPVRVDSVDVSSRDAVRAHAELVHREVDAIDVLVNNAGVGVNGTFLDTSLEDWDFIVGTNLWGVIYGCHFFVPPMVRRGNWRPRREHRVGSGLCGPGGHARLCDDQIRSRRLFRGAAVRASGTPDRCLRRVSRHGEHRHYHRHALPRRARPARQGKDGRSLSQTELRTEKVAEAIVGAVERNRAFVPVGPEAWLLYAIKRASPNLAAKLMQVGRDRVGR